MNAYEHKLNGGDRGKNETPGVEPVTASLSLSQKLHE